jgi:hypothetical protein
VVGVDLAGELEDGRVGVLVRVGVHVGLQGLQLLWSGGQGVGGEERESGFVYRRLSLKINKAVGGKQQRGRIIIVLLNKKNIQR